MSENVRVEVVDGHVGLITMTRAPHNYLTAPQVEDIASALEAWDGDPGVRAAVLAAEGRSFCAGAAFGAAGGDNERGAVAGTELTSTERLYSAAARLCDVATPWIAAVQGPAIGGGLGLAMTANLVVTSPDARFSANFVKLGIHQGFGLSATLPARIGTAAAAAVLLTGRRYKGDEAVGLGLADFCVPADRLLDEALRLARDIAVNAPLAIEAINRTLRAGLGDLVRAATKREAAEQARLSATADAREGIKAVAERRDGAFTGS
jgi:enoyl-CoA hydratase/carnithine racemase